MSSGVLVTGASGFLGGATAQALHRDGWRVVATGRDPHRLKSLEDISIETVAVALDAGPLEPLAARLDGVGTVVHCAALSNPWGRPRDFDAANVVATRRMLALARTAGVRRFVHISSPSVCAAFEDRVLVREDDPLPRPVNGYARTKALSEALVLAEPGPRPIVIRPRAIYGAGDRSLLPRLLAAARRGPLPLLRGGRAMTDPTHVDDVVEAIRCAIGAPADVSGIFNVSGGEAIRVVDFASRALRCVGVEARWRSLPASVAFAAADALSWMAAIVPGRPEPPVTRFALASLAYTLTLDLSRTAERLGWQPRISLEEGLRRTFGKPA